MEDVLLGLGQPDGGPFPEEQRQALALRAHLPRVVLHHVEDVVHRVGVHGDLSLPEEVHDPALLLVLEELPEDLLPVLRNGGHDPAVHLGGKPAGNENEGRVRGRGLQVVEEQPDLLRALDLFHAHEQDHAVAREERLVSQAQDDVRHPGLPAVEPRDLRRFLEPGGQGIADRVDEGRFLSFFRTEEEMDRSLLRGGGCAHE